LGARASGVASRFAGPSQAGCRPAIPSGRGDPFSWIGKH
jgi:hypothetical protein